MSSDPNKQQGQYPPPQWDAARGAYPIPQQPALNYRGPPHSQPYPNPSTPGQGDMVTLPPPGHQPPPDYYRHPPYDMYPGHPQDPHRGPPPPHHMYAHHNPQPAPRQRTAIACRYCRRRKIRCSGFEASEDGRCTNCQRFQQECIFTPVSAHASAFVPAHTAYPHLRNAPIPQRGGGRPLYPQQGPPPAIYGAHGQPLGMPMPGQDPNYPPPPHGYPPMTPPSHPYGAQMYDDRGPPQPSHPKDQVSRKRPRPDESPHPPVAAPPPPSSQASSSHPYHHEQGRPPATTGRRGSGGGYEYPDPTGLVPVSPASSVTSYQSAPYSQPPGQQPYYPPPNQPARRSSPQSSYSYDQRASGSPHGSTSSASAYGYAPAGLHPPQVLPPRDSGRTPPRRNSKEGGGNGSGQRSKMGIHDLLSESSGGRTSADSDMVKALDRKGM
ncbi:MAG: hypothetical protein Q9222_003629 [Ikaeria aurantiellina]